MIIKDTFSSRIDYMAMVHGQIMSQDLTSKQLDTSIGSQNTWLLNSFLWNTSHTHTLNFSDVFVRNTAWSSSPESSQSEARRKKRKKKELSFLQLYIWHHSHDSMFFWESQAAPEMSDRSLCPFTLTESKTLRASRCLFHITSAWKHRCRLG